MKMKIDLSQWIHRRRTEIKTRESLLNNSVSLFQTVTKKLDPYWLAITTTIPVLSFDISLKISRQKSAKIAIFYSWHKSYFLSFHVCKMVNKDSSYRRANRSLFATIISSWTNRDCSDTVFMNISMIEFQNSKITVDTKNSFLPQ